MLNSCNSFLNVDTLGKSTIGGFFSDPDGLRSAGVGLHYLLLDFADDEYMIYGELAGDLMNVNRVNAGLAVTKIFDFDNLIEDSTGYPGTIWKSAYELCTNANNILHYGKALLEKYPDYKDEINKHFGYAYFTRAYAHFCLCNIFAQSYSYTPDASHLGVVIIDYIPGFNSVLKRSTVAQCYDKIILDLNEAIKCFAGTDCADPNYISGMACEALLARVYLYKKDYAKAAEYASKVMTERPLTSRDKYIDMFRKAQDVCGSESILRMNSYNSTSTLGNKCNPTKSTSELVPCDEFCNLMSSRDIRKELYTYYSEIADGPEYQGLVAKACCKYIPFKDGVQDEMNRRCDPFILRSSEMYLIHAEAICNIPGADLNSAADDIRTLRARALGCKKEEISLNWKNAEELDKIVQEERSIELFLEGHRFYDLKRRGESIIRPKSSTSMLKRLDYPHYKFALPINQIEMEANTHMVQNEGYIN